MERVHVGDLEVDVGELTARRSRRAGRAIGHEAGNAEHDVQKSSCSSLPIMPITCWKPARLHKSWASRPLTGPRCGRSAPGHLLCNGFSSATRTCVVIAEGFQELWRKSMRNLRDVGPDPR